MKLFYKLIYSVIIFLEIITVYFIFNFWIENWIFSALCTSFIGIYIFYMFFILCSEKMKLMRNISLMIDVAYFVSFFIKTWNMTRGRDEYMALMYPAYIGIFATFLIEICPIKE